MIWQQNTFGNTRPTCHPEDSSVTVTLLFRKKTYAEQQASRPNKHSQYEQVTLSYFYRPFESELLTR